MEAVSEHAFVSQAARQSEQLSETRLGPVELRVEASNLRNIRPYGSNCTNGGQIVRLMARRKLDQLLQFGHDFNVNANRSIEAKATVNDSVSCHRFMGCLAVASVEERPGQTHACRLP
jgi:hypothetical protein